MRTVVRAGEMTDAVDVVKADYRTFLRRLQPHCRRIDCAQGHQVILGENGRDRGRLLQQAQRASRPPSVVGDAYTT